MENNGAPTQAAIRDAFHVYERDVRVRNYKVGCLLAFIFMPAGASLDYFVYPHNVWTSHLSTNFLALRLLCSALLAAIGLGLHFRPKTNYYRVLGSLVALLPLFSIAWMIYVTQGGASPYYAGLNIVMLGAALLLRWTLFDSIVVFLLSIAAYLAACTFPGPHGPIPHSGIFFNNFYFLFVTGVFIITGSWFYNEIRFREFSLRFELDQNRRQLEESNQKLKELDEAKGRFFANISHELRTPLTLLIAPLETILNRHQVDPDTKELLLTMRSNGMRLLKLINDLLDLVRLESGRLEARKEPVEVADLIKGLASATRQVADDKRVRLETHVDSALGGILGDRDKLEKIILNLVFNALKFTPSGGLVQLRAEKQGDEFVIIVADTGMGISAKNLPNIFSRFWQADDSSRRKYQGVGIGLALVKELTEVQGGKASVDSIEGKGTTFTIRLPYLKADPAAVPIGVSEPQKTAVPDGQVTSEEWLANLYRRAEMFPSMTALQDNLKPVEASRNANGKLPAVLVADDEPDMLRFLKSQLSSHYRVIEAVDGQQAIEKASQFLPDIILLDMMMPEKDGLQACKEIRERTPTASIPIVLLTARADDETKLAALKAGASDFLPKPFSTTELHVRVKNLVESHHYQRNLSKQKIVLENTIDQLKETETQLVQTEKLASLGRMSAGIIHEINNPLNFATTGLYTLRNKAKYLAPEQRDEYAEILKDVEEGIARVKNIVSDLRTFTHPDAEGRDQIEVSEIVTSGLRFLSSEWRDKIKIEQHIPDHQSIWANKSKLIQVVVNLLQNSIDAMKRKKYPDGEAPEIRIEGRLEEGLSSLSIRDNGSGIDAAHIDKIFDPFFTTKDVGEGMGLGLSICYRIVQQYEGRIDVRSEPGKFCEFILEFPRKGGHESVDSESVNYAKRV
jgi:signal transduction histidine kinase